jgi:hypothetical protein
MYEMVAPFCARDVRNACLANLTHSGTDLRQSKPPMDFFLTDVFLFLPFTNFMVHQKKGGIHAIYR